ncbi:MAG: bifunctional diguanylate cyclase/phosphodiesterase [Methylophilaceae bacterium]
MKKTKRAGGWHVRYWYELLPWLALAFSLPVAYFVWNAERTAEFNVHQSKFEYQLNQVSNQFFNQLNQYEQSLYAIKGFFDSSTFVSEAEFDAFVSEILHSKFSNGLNRIAYAKFINPLQPDTYNRVETKYKGQIAKLDKQTNHAPVIYLVEQNGVYKGSQLDDVFQNKVIKEGFEYSVIHNQVVVLTNAGWAKQYGDDCDCVLMILPVFKPQSNKNIQSNIGDRAEADGWVFLQLDLNTIFKNVLNGRNTQAIRFSLYKNSSDTPNNMLYDSEVDVGEKSDFISAFTAKKQVEVLGQKWMMLARSLPLFEKKLNYKQSTIIGIFGLLLSIALTTVLFLVIARVRALDSLRHVNKRLKFSDDRWRFALEGSGDGIWDWDIVSNHVVYSTFWKQMLGYDEDEIGSTLDEWQSRIHPEDYSNAIEKLNTCIKEGRRNYSLECRFKCKDDSWKWVLARGMVVNRNELGEPLRMVGTNTDISQLKQSEEMVWQHANFDALTGLPNRRMLNSRLEQELNKSNRTRKKLALMFLDLDDFKGVNDTLGHDYGDALLKVAAERLINIVYSQDVVARLGGDEFIILVSELEKEKINDLDLIAHKVLAALSEPFVLDGQKVFVSASIGITIFPDDSESLEELLKCVDQAMYASKKRGGNCFTYFTPAMQDEAVHRLHLSNDLREALSKNQLYLEYQPIIDLKTQQIYKCEALLRWQHPERGIVSPAEFIPIAENTRLINDIGGWVFKEAIKQCKEWRQAIHKDFQVAINKSPVQFTNNDEKNTEWLLEVDGNEALNNAVVVEITEGLLLDASAQVEERLNEYRDKGVQVALDDFGTGYSSLAYLRRFDIDYLKIDQSFVASLEASNEDQVLCRAIVAMAHNLDIKVIAEGIETKQQSDILTSIGCDFGQGFYYSKSLQPDLFEAYVKQS